ncbi:MAG: hypothetical protein WCL19_09175 [Verrucomicrobiota bacterium]
MQTTIRIDENLYREAKAEAAGAGLSLTRFLEECLRSRLETEVSQSGAPHGFRTYAGEKADPRTWDEVCQVADDAQEALDFAKLGLSASQA